MGQATRGRAGPLSDAGGKRAGTGSASSKRAKKTAKPRIIRDREFAKRFNTACDEHPDIPAYNFGRLTWIVRQFRDRYKTKVSPESVRKWSAGEARPRPRMMKLLARLLDADEAWLSLGLAPDLQPKEQRLRNIALGGAANIVTGCIQLDGGVVAFPAETDPRAAYVHIYAIVKGAQYAVHAALAQDAGEGVYRFVVPAQYEECAVIGLIRLSGLRFDLVDLSAETISERGTRKGGYYEVEVSRKGTGYIAGENSVRRITDFAHRL